jgi:cytochrome P450
MGPGSRSLRSLGRDDRQELRCEPMLTIDFTDPATNADPFRIFRRLRESDPVHWSEPMKAWVVTRYDDVKAISLNNTEVSANRLAPFFAAVSEGRRTGYVSLMTRRITRA